MSTSMRSLWLKWKALRLPWRRQFLVGADLQGNTYWEFRDTADPTRMRRIVRGATKLHHSDVQLSPQWHQWLRRTRIDPPSIEEQHGDVARQIQLKENARLADERWAAKARYIEKPKEQVRRTFGGAQEEVGGTGESIRGGDAPKTEPSHKEGVRQGVASNAEQSGMAEKEVRDPWEDASKKQRQQTASNPGGAWQPEAWSPGSARKR